MWTVSSPRRDRLPVLWCHHLESSPRIPSTSSILPLPDPSIFPTEGDPVGIQIGTAIAMLVRKANHEPAASVRFQHLWGQAKRAELTETAEGAPDAIYEGIKLVLPLGLPFARTAVRADWFDWPALPDLFPVSFPGVETARNSFFIHTDLDRLKARVADYFDPHLKHV